MLKRGVQKLGKGKFVQSQTILSSFNYDEFLHKTVHIISILYPFSILPQIYEIWINKNTEGVSLLMWVLFIFATLILMLYAHSKGERKLLLMYAAFCLTYLIVVIGLLMF